MRAVIKRLSRFAGDERGSMSVEFLIWIPLLMGYLLFMTTAFLAMDSRLEAMRASIALTDIVSREEDPITREFLDDLEVMMTQLTPSAAPGTMYRISALKRDGADIVVEWTECFGGIEALTADNLPNDVIPPIANLSTVLIVETFVPYVPVSDAFGMKPLLFWTNRKVVTPRYVQNVINDDADVDQCGGTTVSS